MQLIVAFVWTWSVAACAITVKANDIPQAVLTSSLVDAGLRDTGEDNFVQRSIFGPRSRYQPSRDWTAAVALDADDARIHCGDSLASHAPFQGIASFAHLPQADCFSDAADETFDIAIVGAPFDLGVTYRPGARFGPSGARMGSRRLSQAMGWRHDWAKIVDCGDIANSPFDKLVAISELENGSRKLLSTPAANNKTSTQPRLITLGGDHTISLPAIRALNATWGPVALLHFDSHLDSWDPKQIGGGVTRYSELNHGSMFHILHGEHALLEGSNMHLGSRSMLFDNHEDMENDARCGFSVIKASDIDKLGVDQIVQRVQDRVGQSRTYVSIDIDVLDPAFAPATGTLEAGGWTSRELLAILRGLTKAGIKIVGADVVEFTPVYDNTAESSGVAVAQIVYELLQWMIKVPVPLKSY
ncbi:hypothetical protein LTS10_008376 [Elasticomyces elasticus]|nr:hypothetical protein LTS10_008376 [Elasticomyces elasticus]